jgi:hypothetical protein
MTKYVALDPSAHRELKINTDALQAQGANERIVPVVISEFPKLVIEYPIVFTKHEETGRFVCVAVLGFEPKENLFWQNGVWTGIYTPLNVLRQPFFIGYDEGRSVICIDEQAACVTREQGSEMFDAQGGETAYLKDVKRMLSDLLAAERATKTFTETLVALDLLIPMPIEVTFGNGDKRSVKGFYTIDEKKLNSLESDKLVSLQKAKYLSPLYMIISSMGHFYSLINMKNTRLSVNQNDSQG